MTCRPMTRSIPTRSGDPNHMQNASPQYQAFVKRITAELSERTINELRYMARLWGWQVKGTAKNLIVDAIAGKLCDPSTMGPALSQLPEVERHTLAWLAAMPGLRGVELQLTPMLTQALGKSVSEAEITSHLFDLHARGLVTTSSGAFETYPIFAEWLPRIAPAGMLYEKSLAPTPSLSAAAFSLHADNLIALVAGEKPPLTWTAQEPRTYEPVREITPSHSPISADILREWGYESPAEQHMARFLLTALMIAGIVQANRQAAPIRLETSPENIAFWQALAPERQQFLLGQLWSEQLLAAQPAVPANMTWSEMELVLEFHRQQRTGIGMQRAWLYYDQNTPNSRLINRALLFAASAIAALRTDTWYSFERFCQVLRASGSNLVGPPGRGDMLQFTSGRRILDANSMDPTTWLTTYGSIVAAWLLGPARWLGLVELAVKNDRIIAFQRPEKTRSVETIVLPPDTLQFGPAGEIVLRTIWQAAELRDLVLQIAAPVARDRKHITFRLDPAAFRLALRRGQSAGEIVAALARRGFPLPAESQRRIEQWAQRAGRFRIYDNLAAIEFGDDLAQREVESAAGLGQRQTYAASNRCSILLDSASAGEIAEALQRRGYLPKVLP